MQDSPIAGAERPAAPPLPIGGGSLSNCAAVLGALLLFAACGYRRIWHPDWSGAEALAALWPVYVLGCIPILLRWVMVQPWVARTRS
jgi:hypothetical protein